MRKRMMAALLSATILIGVMSGNGVFAYSDAFDTNQSLTFDSFIAAGGWNRSRIQNPPNPTDPDGTWTAKYGGEAVRWQDPYQTELYFDGIYGTTGPYVWGIDAGFLGSSGALTPPTGSGSTIVEIARSQLGVREMGTNRVGYVDWYLGGPPNDYVPWEWCCIFVIWCANQLGYLDQGIFARTGSCSNMYSFMTETMNYSRISVREAWQGGQEVLPGDILLFYSGGRTFCHIGIIEEVGPDCSYIQTIEGNTSGRFDPTSPGGHSIQGVYRQRYKPTSNYPAMQNGYIIRPNYPA